MITEKKEKLKGIKYINPKIFDGFGMLFKFGDVLNKSIFEDFIQVAIQMHLNKSKILS